ncbi:MAG: leucine-rich repeat domain-containing protein [Alloprevotella sp.]
MKRTRYLFTLLLLLPLSFLPVWAQIAQGSGWTLESDGTLRITSDEAWDDPCNMYYLYPQGRAFDVYADQVKKIVIGEGVTYVAEWAFHPKHEMTEDPMLINDFDYNNVTAIEISSTVRDIQSDAFGNCPWIENGCTVTFADNSQLTTIGEDAFYGSEIASLTLPEGVTTIGDYAFGAMYSLRHITLPSTLTSMGRSVFYYSNVLESITFNSPVAPTIGGSCFDTHSSNFNTVNIPDHARGYDRGEWLAVAGKLTAEHLYTNGICSVDDCEQHYMPLDSPVDGCYELHNAGQLVNFARLVNGYGDAEPVRDANARLTADIDLAGVTDWQPIGYTTFAEAVEMTEPETLQRQIGYQGSFDGQGHTVSHLTSPQGPDNAMPYGLFGLLEGKVSNLGVENASLVSGSSNKNASRAGAIAGVVYPDGQINNCYVYNCSVSGYSVLGLLVGMNYGGTVSNCYVQGSSCENFDRGGGLCGDAQNDSGYFPGTFANCYAGNFSLVGGNKGNEVRNLCAENLASASFTSGEVAYRLNTENFTEASLGVFRQNLTGDTPDDHPVLTASHAAVYAEGTPQCPNDLASITFSNTESSETIVFPDTHPFDNGFCGYCTEIEPATMVHDDVEDIDLYEIGNAGQLYWFARLVNGTLTDGTAKNLSANARLTADIVVNDFPLTAETAEARQWEMMNYYKGRFEGNRKTISGLYYKGTDTYIGFVRRARGASFNQLGLVNGYFDASESMYSTTSAAIVGYAEETNFTNCFVHQAVCKGNGYAGTFAGDATYSTISNCYASASLEGERACGAFVSWGMDLNGSNNYFLDTMGNAVGEGNADNFTAIPAPDWDFASGAVALALGTTVYGQRIGGEQPDAYPSFVTDANHIFSVEKYDCEGNSSSVYTNADGLALSAALDANAVAVTENLGLTELPNVILRQRSPLTDEYVYTCRYLRLTDAKPFRFNLPFTAEQAEFALTTDESFVWADGQNGWHSLCAPISGHLCVDGEEKQAIPSNSGSGHYWLKELRGYDASTRSLLFGYATEIESGKPYILALPGESFGEDSFEGKRITVVGTNVSFPATAQASDTYGGLFYAGSLTGKAALDPDGNAIRYQLNPEGNAFVATYAAVKPFGTYVYGSSLNIGTASTLSVAPFLGEQTAIDELLPLTEGSPVNVYDLNGRLVKQQVQPADALQGLPSGVYLINGHKVVK